MHNFKTRKIKNLKTINILDISHPDLNIKNYIKRDFKKILRDFFDYLIRKNFYYFKYKNFFKKQNYYSNLTLPSKGFSDEARKKKLNSIKKIEKKSMLCVGCGNGFELLGWLKFNPSSIKAIDIFNYSSSWKRINKYINEKKFNTRIKFSQKNILNINEKKKFDFIISDAVFEHLKDFDKVISHCVKLLKDDGIIYASYGPLWFSYGGDHFSGRDSLNHGLNHLILNKNQYSKYYKKNITKIKDEIKYYGSGGLFVKEKLFSKKSGNEYMDTFKKNNLISAYTVLEFCPIGLNLMKNNIILGKKILKKYKKLHIEDLYLKSQIVYLKKKNDLY